MKAFVNHKYKLLGLLAVLTFLLAACLPVQQATLTLINAVGAPDDPAVLVLASSEVLFYPHGAVEGVALLIEGRNLVSSDERCHPTENGVGCIVDYLDDELRVEFQSDGGLSTSVSFIRGDELRFLIASDPVQ